ncbi:hypothetical protein BVY04_02335 [bacterium M21]|nr:hypothetical protein BVY04_02335 [bacterium M21]
MIFLRRSLRLKLMTGIILLAFLAGTGVFLVMNARFVRITDQVQEAVHQEKLGTIVGTLQSRHDRLTRTGAVDTYVVDFQKTVLKELRETLYTGKTASYITIIDDHGTVVLHPDGLGAKVPWGEVNEWLPPGESQGVLAQVEWQGERKACYYRRFAPWNWTVIYCVPWSMKYGDLRSFQMWLGGSIIIGLLLACVIMGFFVQRWLLPIQDLTDAAAAMSRGELDVPVFVSGQDEIGVLAKSFADMRTSIADTIEALNREVGDRRRAEATMVHLGDMLENTSDFVLMSEAGGRLVYMNRASRCLFSWLGEESGAVAQSIYPDWAGQLIENEGVPTAKEKGLWVGETAVLTQEGTEIPVSHVIVAHLGGNGELEFVSSILRDLSEVKNKEVQLKEAQADLEVRVSERTEELRLINDSLRQESEQHRETAEQLKIFKAFADTAGQGMGIGTMDTRLVYVNPTLRGIAGIGGDEKVDDAFFVDFYGPKEEEIFRDEVIPIILEQGSWNGEIRLTSRAGEVISTYESMFLIRDEEDVPQYIATLITDITDRKAVEEELRQYRVNLEKLVETRTQDLATSNRELQHEIEEHNRVKEALQQERDFSMGVINRTPSVICGLDEKGRVNFINPAGEKVFGYSVDEMRGRNWWDALHPGSQHAQVEELFRKLRGGDVRNYEMVSTAKDGTIKTVSWNSLTRRDSNGELTETIAVGHDVTERRVAEQALRISEEKYRALYSESKDAYMLLSPKEGFVSCNNAAVQLFACRDEAHFCEFSLAELSPGGQPDGQKSAEKAEKIVAQTLKEGSNFFEWRHRRADGTEFDATVLLFCMDIEDETILQATVRDVSEQQQIQKALAESEERYRSLITNFPGMIYRCVGGEENTLEYVSDSIEELTGYPSETFLGKPMKVFTDLIVEEDFDRVHSRVMEALEKHRQFTLRFALLHSSGEVRHVYEQGRGIYDENGTLLHIDGIVHDISEQTALEEQLRQAHKMDSIGQLAGGVAHDFNNMLGGISGAAELLKLRLKDDDKLLQFVSIISDASKRASELTQKLLSFSRKARTITVSFNVHDSIREAVVLLERSIDKRIVLTCDFDAEQSIVVGDPTQLQNAILNLGVNARDAMEQGGELFIATTNLFLDEEFCRRRATKLQPGEFIEISVRDTGTGISADVQERMFEPFYTTKGVSKGTGLGLAAVYGTITEHGGFVEVQSSLGKGTVIKAFLPISTTVAQVAPQVGEETIMGTGHVLLVDDEEIIRSMASMMLENLGYRVTLAQDGLEALEIYQEQGADIDLVLLDMVMPNKDGAETFRELKRMQPNVRVVLCSGFSREQSIDELLDEGACGFVQKPYRRAVLSVALAQANGRR